MTICALASHALTDPNSTLQPGTLYAARLPVVVTPFEPKTNGAQPSPESGGTYQWRYGQLDFDWGFEVRSSDPRFGPFVAANGANAELETAAGFLVRYDTDWGQAGRPKTLLNFRLVDDPAALRRIGRMKEHQRALRGLPVIRGYRFVNETTTPHWGWIGLWRKSAGEPETLVIVYSMRESGKPPCHRVLATLPFSLSILSALPDLESNAMAIDLASAARNGAPLRLIRLMWNPNRLC